MKNEEEETGSPWESAERISEWWVEEEEEEDRRPTPPRPKRRRPQVGDWRPKPKTLNARRPWDDEEESDEEAERERWWTAQMEAESEEEEVDKRKWEPTWRPSIVPLSAFPTQVAEVWRPGWVNWAVIPQGVMTHMATQEGARIEEQRTW